MLSIDNKAQKIDEPSKTPLVVKLSDEVQRNPLALGIGSLGTVASLLALTTKKTPQRSRRYRAQDLTEEKSSLKWRIERCEDSGDLS